MFHFIAVLNETDSPNDFCTLRAASPIWCVGTWNTRSSQGSTQKGQAEGSVIQISYDSSGRTHVAKIWKRLQVGKRPQVARCVCRVDRCLQSSQRKAQWHKGHGCMNWFSKSSDKSLAWWNIVRTANPWLLQQCEVLASEMCLHLCGLRFATKWQWPVKQDLYFFLNIWFPKGTWLRVTQSGLSIWHLTPLLATSHRVEMFFHVEQAHSGLTLAHTLSCWIMLLVESFPITSLFGRLVLPWKKEPKVPSKLEQSKGLKMQFMKILAKIIRSVCSGLKKAVQTKQMFHFSSFKLGPWRSSRTWRHQANAEDSEVGVCPFSAKWSHAWWQFKRFEYLLLCCTNDVF